MGELMHTFTCFLALQTTVQAHTNERIGFPDRPTAATFWKAAEADVKQLEGLLDICGWQRPGWDSGAKLVGGGRMGEQALDAWQVAERRRRVWEALHGCTDDLEQTRNYWRSELRERIGEEAFHARRWPW